MRGHLFEARRRLDVIAATPWSRRSPRPAGPAAGGARRRVLVAGGHRADAPRLRGGGRALASRRQPGGARQRPLQLLVLLLDADRPARGAVETSIPTGSAGRRSRRRWSCTGRLGDERGQANVLWGIGNKHYFQGDPRAGIAQLGEALEIYRRVGDRTMEAWALHMLGGCPAQARGRRGGSRACPRRPGAVPRRRATRPGSPWSSTTWRRSRPLTATRSAPRGCGGPRAACPPRRVRASRRSWTSSSSSTSPPQGRC